MNRRKVNINYQGSIPDLYTQEETILFNCLLLTDIFKTAVGFPGEETAAPALGLALSAPAGQKSVPARPPRGF